nr:MULTISPECIES: hypothetical protein [Polymorphobacter]
MAVSSGGDECCVLGFHVGVKPDGDVRGHVKSASQFRAAARDMAFSAMLPAIASDRCKTGQRRELLVIESVEFGHIDEHGDRRKLVDMPGIETRTLKRAASSGSRKRLVFSSASIAAI